MKKQLLKSIRLFAILMIASSFSLTMKGQNNSIIEPNNRELVSMQYTASGKVKKADNEELWVVISIDKYARLGSWYLQGSPSVYEDGSWSIDVYFGQAHDTGKRFSIMAFIPATQTDHLKLKKMYGTMVKTGNYYPVNLEDELSGFKLLEKVDVIRKQ